MADKNEIDRLLSLWQDIPAGDPQLKHKVWTRIASKDPNPISRYRDWLLGIPNLVSRPVPSMVFIGACIAAGILIAEIRVSNLKQTHTEALAQSYIQLIDSMQPIKEVLK